jgi:sugar O-acyltransferase (sialic acid O-acetyltransferase NeuD family)
MFVAIGYKRVNKARAEVYNSCKSKGYELISYISSKAIHLSHVEIGDNCFIRAGSVIQPFAKIGNDVIIGSACVGHESIIGDHCYIANHAALAGGVKIGPYCFVGLNATIRDGITVAPECVIGAGAIILKDTEEGGVYPGQKAERAPFPSSQLRSFR